MIATYLDHKSELIKFCADRRPKNAAAVTLTFKPYLFVDGYWIRLDEYHCRQNLRHFLSKLNRKVFRNGVRAGRRLWCLPVLEGCSYVNLHYHIDLEIPRDWDFELFAENIYTLWIGTDWGGQEIDVQIADEGWITYILKRRSKASYLESVDWTNASTSA